MATHNKITKDEIGTRVSQTVHRSIIGNLLYLIASQSDNSFSIGICARYQVDPKDFNMSSVKRVMRYIVGTTD